MSINILSWNCQSVLSKMYELQNYIKDPKNSTPNLILLQETWLNPKQTVKIPNFNCIRNDRNSDSRRPHGGVLIFIHKDIKFKIINFPNLKFIEGVFISVDTGSFTLTMGSIYSSSSLSRNEAKNDIKKLLSMQGPFVLVGDWNAKSHSWNNICQNFKGIDLKKICDEKMIDINFPDFPTLNPDNRKGELSIVDFALSKNVYDISKPKTVFELSSDHRPITFQIKANFVFPEISKVKSFKRANWKKFRDHIEEKLDNLTFTTNRTPELIDLSIKLLNESILSASKVAIPLVKPTQFRYPFSHEIEELCRQRSFIRRRMKHHNLTNLRSQINFLNKEIKRLTGNLKSRSWSDKLSSLKAEDLSFYDFTKKIKRKDKGSVPLKNSSGDLIYSDFEKANLIADSFHKSHIISEAPTKHTPEVEKSLDTLRNLPVDFPEIERVRLSEVKDLINRLKIKKACGFDDISNRLVKNVPVKFIEKLVDIFNNCLRIGYFPKAWKIAKVIALDKPGKDASMPSNKRPISLLPVLGKLFERTILTRLVEFGDDQNLIINQQFGFRSQHSTTQQLMRVIEFISLRFNQNISTGMIFLDIEKAFDSVWHDALTHKLLKYGFPTYLIKAVTSFLCGRQAFISVNSQKSNMYDIPAGTPQGSILSPFLYILFNNDVPVPKGCKVAVFADDTAITCSAKNYNMATISTTLTNAGKKIVEHLTEWKIKCNTSKTETILFSKSPRMLKLKDSHKITFGNEILEWKNTVKYLGMMLDSKLLMKANIDHNISKAKKAIATLYCLLKRYSPVKTNEKIIIVRSYLRPILTYACPAFAHCAKTHLRKLQIVQNKALRMALNAPYRTHIEHLHKAAKMPMIDAFIQKITKNFYEKAELSTNPLIKRIGAIDRSSSFNKIKHRIPCKN